jgi:hypothetical protein
MPDSDLDISLIPRYLCNRLTLYDSITWQLFQETPLLVGLEVKVESLRCQLSSGLHFTRFSTYMSERK